MKNKIVKRVLLGILIIFAAIQFVPVSKNTGNTGGPNDITTVVVVPGEVLQVLSNSCYDCHSNKTNYPWYSYIQPVGLWLNYHIDEGKHKLNFNEFATYNLKRQLHKLDEVIETIDEQEMPLESYALIHKTSRLSDEQKQVMVTWVKQSKLQLQDTLQ